MTRLHFFRNLRTAFVLLMALLVLAAAGGLWWANATGMPEAWRQKVEQALHEEGVNVSVGSLSYRPFHGGLVATEIRVFTDPTRTKTLSRLKRVAIDFDKSLLTRGEMKITKFELRDGHLDLPIDPEDPNSAVLEVSHVNAVISRPGGRILDIRNASGRIEGIDVFLSARMLGFRPGMENAPENDPDRKAQLEAVKRFLDEVQKWKFSDEHRPKVTLAFDGDLADRSSLHGSLKLTAPEIEKGGHTLENITAEGEWSGTLLTLTSLAASDSRGTLTGRVDYDVVGREGRFGVASGLDLMRLLRSWFGVNVTRDVTFAGAQKIETSGSFRLVDHEPPDVSLIGFASCESVMVRGVMLDSFESEFSWGQNSLFLKDIKALSGESQLTGKLLYQDHYIRSAIKTNMPLAAARPFFLGQPFGKVLNDFKENEHTKVDADLECGFDVINHRNWVVTGHARVEQCTYRGTPFLLAETNLDLSRAALNFIDGTVLLDYRRYPLQEAYQGAASSTLKVKQVSYDYQTDIVTIDDLTGKAWPAPVVRMFAKSIADDLEQYRFHQPPTLRCSGTVGTAHEAVPGATRLRIAFETEAPAHYRFIGENLLLHAPSGVVQVQDEKVTVDHLAFHSFGGPVTGQVAYDPSREHPLRGEFSWTKLSFRELADLYGFDPKGGGYVTGRFEFTSGTKGTSHLNGKGLMALEKGELFSVPMFGPLSPLISGILFDRRAGFQRAKDAFLTFTIRNGVLQTNDFRTATSSLVFTGDARIDLDKLDLDMTMRMNARGLLGVLTLPLRPFYGLFQFHGSGPLKNPEWRNVIFTSPPDAQKEALLNPPRATVVEDG